MHILIKSLFLVKISEVILPRSAHLFHLIVIYLSRTHKIRSKTCIKAASKLKPIIPCLKVSISIYLIKLHLIHYNYW
ncbi:hypothetical protein SteCoe_12442 [Stentor coeruleus]|uniref:Uncharacterized protein n=1 Tax=Stentor coeruleus TaxID=5963 RepID=A0A1R2CAQ7_9CILI|nr:hypothetical protein SteCoe_12442 [Stentor coeruleus]